MPYLEIDPNDLLYHLPADAYLVLTLNRHLIAQISALPPNDSVEAALAAGFVIANEQAGDCDHWVQVHLAAERDKLANHCRAQSISLTREAKRALRELGRRLAATKKRHADPDATDATERIGHITTCLPAEGYDRLAESQKPEPAPAAITVAPAPPPEPAPTPGRTELTVSSHDPTTQKYKTETTARQSLSPCRNGPIHQRLISRAKASKSCN